MRIALDSSREAYHPGDLLRGRVILGRPEVDTIQGSLAIAFLGRSTISHTRFSVANSGEIVLFRSECCLYSGDRPATEMPPGGWPFIFAFPNVTIPAPETNSGSTLAERFPSDDDEWEEGSAYRLPPSTTFEFPDGVVTGHIEYLLRAIWRPRQVRDGWPKISTLSLLFAPGRREKSPLPHLVTLRSTLELSYIVDAEDRFRPVSFYDHVRPGAHITCASFLLQVTIAATRVIQGARIPVELLLRLAPDQQPQQRHQPTPPIFLHSFTAHTEVITSVAREEGRYTSERTVVLGMRRLNEPLVLDRPLDVNRLLDLGTGVLGPDFVIANAMRRHRLFLCIELSCLERLHFCRFDVPLVVLASFYAERPPGVGGGF
ncbi:hypothetical protein P168DRAFT_315646 [Aspergillus campestris IBT 28561]|uniref:Arrestin-like N-terminal domain-containing protein n=1 Tax=Aspergillus campestris (strain IBT 28561) TaxID=1392248 RepID=A0A2I1DB83_ASPC2|nr:uncharacterized protein P168DRAFT_315646 [Aspergillus campestris IBT 28561]PKY07125.1 hypothetical protein P168DRAFT_315646 [Aspergillus campestris IBT 28561]